MGSISDALGATPTMVEDNTTARATTTAGSNKYDAVTSGSATAASKAITLTKRSNVYAYGACVVGCEASGTSYIDLVRDTTTIATTNVASLTPAQFEVEVVDSGVGSGTYTYYLKVRKGTPNIDWYEAVLRVVAVSV